MLRAALLAAVLAAVGCGDEPDERPATWSYIHAAILVPNCTTSGCHSTLTRSKGLDLEDKQAAYEVRELLNAALLRGAVPDLPRMPPDQPLPEADIALIERWQAMGSLEN